MVRWFASAAVTALYAALTAATANAQCAPPGNVATACTGDCATLKAPDLTAAKNSQVNIPLMFTQAPNDSQADRGADEVAAIAFTLGAPGTGTSAPLTFDCTDGNLADGSVTGVPDNFTVVIENAQCTNRNHCLCADTSAGQTRDNFVNIVVYGPRNLPEQGPVQIPVLPNSGNIVTLRMRVANEASATIPLHIFSGLDTGPSAKPQFAANLSLGDKSACDVTATGERSNIVYDHGQITVTDGGGSCVGDCNGDGEVGINELIIGVNIALQLQPVANCTAFDPNGDGEVGINELIQGVSNSLNGCPP
jgi:hypothetical protein